MNTLKKRERTRMSVMHAAKGLFEKHGLDNVTFNDIAESASVCRTTVFNHFSDTHELMIALTCQEVNDVAEYLSEGDFKGKALAYKVFEKLIDDACLYPVLTGKLINNAILSDTENNPIRIIEELTIRGLIEEYGETEAHKLFLLISGAYYGIINHYHVNKKEFCPDAMKAEFHQLLDLFLR